MDFYLLILGIVFVILGYGIYLFYYIKYHNILVKNINGFDMAKEITTNYDSINVVESSSLVSKYFLKRKVIKLSSRLYSASDVFSLSLVVILSCISLLKSSYLKFLSKFLPTISFCDMSPIIMAILSFIFYSKGDARFGIILGIIILIYQYCYRQIIFDSIELSKDRVHVRKKEISTILIRICSVHTLFFISSLIFLFRFIVIIIY